jgi:hypothetical protein
MNEQELESIWKDAKDGNMGTLAPTAVYHLLTRIKKGNDWHVSSEFVDQFRNKRKHIEVFRRGMACALAVNQFNNKLKIDDYLVMIDSHLIPLLKHVAMKPRALVDDMHDVKVATGSYLVSYVSDYRNRCWCYLQLLTGSTEFTMTNPNDNITFEIDTVGMKKVVIKSDKTVNSQELSKLSRILIGYDECDMYDEWVRKQPNPRFETSEAYQECPPIRNNYFAADIFNAVSDSDSLIEHARLAMEEALRFKEFEKSVHDMYPKTWEERWLAVMEVILEKAPTLMDSRKHSLQTIAALCKLSLKSGYTATEVVARMSKIKTEKEANHGY